MDFARLHSQVAVAHPYRINPYHLGHAIFENIFQRYNDASEESMQRAGLSSGGGYAKVFEVRELLDDVAFVRNYLTDDLVHELGMYVYGLEDGQWKVQDVGPEAVRAQIIRDLLHSGRPWILVADDDYEGKHGLLLKHEFEGRPLDVRYAEETLKHIHRLWKHSVHLETQIDGRVTVLSFDGKVSSKTIR